MNVLEISQDQIQDKQSTQQLSEEINDIEKWFNSFEQDDSNGKKSSQNQQSKQKQLKDRFYDSPSLDPITEEDEDHTTNIWGSPYKKKDRSKKLSADLFD